VLSSDSPHVSFPEVNTIFQTRCTSCHSSQPSDDLWQSAPNGVMFDQPAQIAGMTSKILERTVTTHSMPLGNKTGMTDEEREKIRLWILQGAKTE